jgi:hypothetical protein
VTWQNTSGIAAGDGNLLILQNGSLHKVAPDTGKYRVCSPETWTDTKFTTLGGGYAYLIRN